MTREFNIRLLGQFSFVVNGVHLENILAKSKKGLTLLQYLIVRGGTPVPNYQLYELLWPNESSTNPENSLKTLISRLRAMLSDYERVNDLVKTSRGSYRFNTDLGLTVDLYRFTELLRALEGVTRLNTENREMFAEALDLYTGDMLTGGEQEEWVMPRAVNLHEKYLQMVYRYLDLLTQAEDFDTLIYVCRKALDVDTFDERLHLSLMNALVKTDRYNDALTQYKFAANVHYRYLGVNPPEGLQEFYKQVIQADRTLDVNIDAIRRELQEYGDGSGAFVCEYAVFKEIYNLQMRNLERLGSTMYIGMMLLTNMDSHSLDPLYLDDMTRSLEDVMVANLRKGDTITHFSPLQYALLLPTVDSVTGAGVMERIKKAFYIKHPNSNVMLTYRLEPLRSGTMIRDTGDAPKRQ